MGSKTRCREALMHIYKYKNRKKDCLRRLAKILSSRQGNLLVYLVVVLLIFGVLGVTIISMFSTATGSAATANDARRALYLAESGIRYALSEVRNSMDLEYAATLLNTTEYKVDRSGSFRANVFSPGLVVSSSAGSSWTLNVPYNGKFPEDFAVQDAAANLFIVDWIRFKGATPDSDSYAAVSSTTDARGATSVTVDLDGADDFAANPGDRICFALQASVDDTTVARGESIYVAEEAKHFFPLENGAVRVMVLGGAYYDVFYEKRELEPGRVKLTNIRELQSTWNDIKNLTTSDYVILTPFNNRVSATGFSGDTSAEIGNYKPFWAIASPSEYTIFMRELVADASIKQYGDVIRKYEGGDERIELGKGATGTEGFGNLWYGGDKPIGGDANFCTGGRCIFDEGVRAFFTANLAGDGEGFTFALIAGGTTAVPVNTENSAGGDFQASELLGYAGRGQKSDGTYLDGTGDGLLPPKIALEFDTRTNLNEPLQYCQDATTLGENSRHDPQPGGAPRDVLQYVFWGNETLAISCRGDNATYDDNRHDAEGDVASLNFAFSAGSPVRSKPTYDPTGGTVYFGSDDAASEFWAVNSEDGSLKWSFPAGSTNVTSKPALDTIGSDRFVYFSTGDNRIYKMQAESGAKEWDIPIGGSISEKVSPAVNKNNHNIYIGSFNDNFYAYNSSGSLLWARDVGEDIQATATIDQTNGNAYVGTDDENSGTNEGQVVAFDTESATPSIPLWTFKTDNDVQSQPAINSDGTVVYAVTDIGKVYAINTASGSIVDPVDWPRDLPDVNFLDPAVWVSGASANNTIYVPTDGGHLYALDPATGNDRPGWGSGKDLGAPITLSSPAVGPDGTVYIGTDGNRVYAINPDGTIKWEYRIPTGADVRSSPEIGADKVVYVGSNDGKLYAIASVAMPRNYRNTYVNFQKAYLTSDDLDSEVIVDDSADWMNGSPMQRGPWAIRVEIERAASVNANGNYEYTILTWMRQCASADCSDVIDTLYQDTTVKYDYSPISELPFTQVIELTPAEHAKFERFLFGFTTAAKTGDTQLTTISDFQLTFIRSSVDPVETADPDWTP